MKNALMMDNVQRETLKRDTAVELSRQKSELQQDRALTHELEEKFREMQLVMEQRKREQEKAKETKERTEALQSEI